MNRKGYAKILQRMADALKQPSSHAGIATILVLAGISAGNGTALNFGLDALAGLFAFTAVVLNETGKKDDKK